MKSETVQDFGGTSGHRICLSVGVHFAGSSPWSENAWERPSYIGEGYVLDRLLKHSRDVEKPFGRRSLDGYVALLTNGPEKQRKTDAEVVEATLIQAADFLGRAPRHNTVSGKLTAVWRRVSEHDTVRVNVSGWHPLHFNSKLRNTARLSWRWDRQLESFLLDEMPWRRS